METKQLMPVLEGAFDRCELLAGAIARCEHRFNTRLRSIYFVKATDDLPGQDDLEQIQSGVVAPSYFSSNDESRWNHYLVFVVPGQAIKKDQVRKAAIESNTKYARKLIVSQSDLPALLDRRDGIEFSSTHNANALQEIWGRLLSEAGLSAINSDEPRTSVIKAIRTGHRSVSAKATRPVTDTQPLAFLKSLEIKAFGDRSIKGFYQFGRVNLVRGVNGAGKTSLLEAIEHFICGGTARARGSEKLDASAVFSNSDRVIHFQQRPASYYVQRDLKWYGRKTAQRNRLYEAFARYNFFSADAAVEFSREEDQQDLASVLSRVALGPDAAFTWDRVLQVQGDLGPQLGALHREITAAEDRIRKAQSRLAGLSEPSPEVSSRISKSVELMSSLGWDYGVNNPVDQIEFDQLAGLRVVLDNAPSELPDSIAAVNGEITEIESTLAELSEMEAAARAGEATLTELDASLKATESLSRAVKRLHQYRQVGFSEVAAALSELNREEFVSLPRRDTVVRLLADVFERIELSGTDSGTSMEIIASSLRLRLEQIQARLDAANSTIDGLTSRIKERQFLVAQIRGLGLQLAREHPLDSCPLCQTTMSMDVLIDRIKRSLSDADATEVANLEAERGELSAELGLLRATQGLMEAVLQAHPQLALETPVSIFKMIDEAEEARARWSSERASLLASMERIQAEGFSMPELMGLMKQCADEIGPKFDQLPLSGKLLDEADSYIVAKRLGIIGDISRARSLQDQLITRLVERAVSASGETDILAAKSKLNERASSLRRFIKAFEELPGRARERAFKDLRSFVDMARIAYAQLASISEDLRQARSRDTEIKKLSEEIESESKSLSRLCAERSNLQAAHSTLRKIVDDYSLERGLAEFLSANLSSIQSIFQRLHVPNELRLSNLTGCELVRKSDGRHATLAQISTGQRAALVLSVFLNLNLSLRLGPPLMLIDDPVAHIDDMNSLAFLDYVGNIAESGRRQIFFATADEKLANLFEKKLGFLGEDFRVISMSRA